MKDTAEATNTEPDTDAGCPAELALLDCGDEYCGEPECCDECMGEGIICICLDDICQGQGWCMHGDGMATCPSCDGQGYYWRAIQRRP